MQFHKRLAVITVFFAVCVSAQAQVTFSSWGRVVVTPIAFTGPYSAVSAATSTWGDFPRIGFSANGTAPSGNIGFNLDFDFSKDMTNNGNIAIIGDNAKAWVRPLGLLLPERFDMLKLTAGFFKEEELRGKIGATEFAGWILPNGSKDEDNIFSRFNADAGAHVRLEPLKWLDSPWNGLTMQMAFGSNAIGRGGNKLRAIWNLFNNEANDYLNESDQYNEEHATWDGTDHHTSAVDVYKAAQYALSYRIPHLGLVRIQYIGSNRRVLRWVDSAIGNSQPTPIVMGINSKTGEARDLNADVFEAAFLYDGLDGLRLDAGVKIPIFFETDIVSFQVYDNVYNPETGIPVTGIVSNKQKYGVQLPYTIALGANWKPSFFSSLNLMTRVDLSFGGKIESDVAGVTVENGYVLKFWLVPSYTVFSNFTVGLDLGLESHGEDTVVNKGLDPETNPDQTAPSKYLDFGFAPWVDLGVGGGKVRIGLVVMIPGRSVYNATSQYDYSPVFKKGAPVVSVPISFTYSF